MYIRNVAFCLEHGPNGLPYFLQKCEHWRSRHNFLSPNILADIYEGRVWKELNCISGRPFLSQPKNLCLMLNVDWFNPYDETSYSAGVMYFVVQNLPRSERYKMENIILAGIIPGPREPKKHINTYLSPLVNDLKRLYAGVVMQNSSSFRGTTLIRALVSCISCDLPATRKAFIVTALHMVAQNVSSSLQLPHLAANQTTPDLTLLPGNPQI